MSKPQYDDDDGLPVPRSRSNSPLSTGFRLKRSHDQASADESSDGPFFSSDDLADAGIDNYTSPRRKKQHRRTWWETETRPTRQPKKMAKDSGVFMSSDSSGNEDGFNDVLHTLPISVAPFMGHTVGRDPAPIELSSSDKRVIAIVRECIEDNSEMLDLSDMNLDNLRNSSLEPLKYMIKPSIVTGSQDEHAFRPLAPALKLILSKNQLKRLPSNLFALEHLAVLSLHRNELVELPHAIGRLRSLTELNIAVNQLRYLPWELLPLMSGHGKLERLFTSPNPFVRPWPSIGSSLRQIGEDQGERSMADIAREALSARPSLPYVHFQYFEWLAVMFDKRVKEHFEATAPRHAIPPSNLRMIGQLTHPMYLGATQPTLFDIRGLPIAKSAKPLASSADCVLQMSEEEFALPSDAPSDKYRLAGPSLFELALRTCATSLSDFKDIKEMLNPDAPEHFIGAIDAAERIQADGGRVCPCCRKPFIIARAEWIEYWHCAWETLWFDQNILPFAKRVCSWACAEASYGNGYAFLS